jgi:hypothetical protein
VVCVGGNGYLGGNRLSYSWQAISYIETGITSTMPFEYRILWLCFGSGTSYIEVSELLVNIFFFRR